MSRDIGDAVAAKLLPAEHSTVRGFSIAPKTSVEFRQAFRAWRGSEPGVFTVNAYDSLITLSKAVVAAGPEPEAVKTFLEQNFDEPGASGRIKFDKQHDVVGSEYEITEVITRSK